jgi:molybdopterin synthase catalytic subunit
MSVSEQSQLGAVSVFTTNYRGLTPEELASQALERIIHVGENMHPAIIEQAKAFKESIRVVLIHYMQQAQQAERSTIVGTLTKHGQLDLANIIRNI